MSAIARFEALADVIATRLPTGREALKLREELEALADAALAEARDAEELGAVLVRAWAADALLGPRGRRRSMVARDPLPPRVSRALAEDYYSQLESELRGA